MGTAEGYFATRDINDRLGIGSESAFWDWVKDGGVSGCAADGWTLTPGVDTFFRGQPDVTFGLTSSLYRTCRYPGPGREPLPVYEKDLARAEASIITATRGEGIGRRLTDGALLAVLQHHGIPTRLIDVSEGAMEALFFAVDQRHSVDGRLFIIHPHPTADASEADTLDFSAQNLPWEGATHGKTRAKDEWTQRVALVEQAPLDPRMHAQRGRFLVGGLNRYSAGRRYEGVTAEEVGDISTLGVNFVKSRTAAPSQSYGATGWTIRIDSDWKPGLLSRLAAEPDPITPDSMYPPLAEVRRLALRVAREAARDGSPA